MDTAAPPRAKLEVVNAYEEGSSLVLLSRRPDGRLARRKVAAEYVSYLRAAEAGDLARELRTSRAVTGLEREGEWLRVTWRDRFSRQAMCTDPNSPFGQRGIKTYEGDVDPVTRWLVDSGADIQAPRPAMLDIETDSRVPFARKEEARVLSWAGVGCDGRTFLDVLAEDTDQAEADLLGRMWEWLEAYDQVCAWSGDGFDFPVLRARTQLSPLRVELQRWLFLDYLELFKRMNTGAESGDEKRSMKIDAIGQALLGRGKDDFDAKFTWHAWAAGGAERERMARYNYKDTDLLQGIEDKTGYLKLFTTLCQACHVLGATRGLNPTKQLDGFLLRLGKARGHHFLTREYRESEEQFKGAYVMEPRAHGIEKNVHVCDFSSMYPSIILSWNMSTDTVAPVPVNGPIPPGTNRSPSTGVGFYTDREGILPVAVAELLRLRKEFSARQAQLPPGTEEWVDAGRRSTAYKVAANSFYGVVGSDYSRYYDRRVAESVTQNGVWLIKETIAAAQARGWKTIYTDTDSVFVQGPSKDEFQAFTDWCNSDLYPSLLEKQGCTVNTIKLAYEKEFERIIFTGKKRYIGRYVHYKGKAATEKSKPEVKGFETRRGDVPKLAARLLQDAIDLLMAKCEDPAPFHEMVKRMRERVLFEPLDVDEIKKSQALSKPLHQYVPKLKKDGTASAQPPHVVVARILLDRGEEVEEGTRIEFIVADGAADPMRVIPASDYTGTEVDRYYVWESMVYPPTQRLLEAAFPPPATPAGVALLSPWEEWARARPRKPRRGTRKAPEGALPLFGEEGSP